MPKIKNWTSVHLKNQWIHDKKEHMVRIQAEGPPNNADYYDIWLHKTPGKTSFRKRIGSDTTIKGAKEKARKWMKNHPNSIKIC